MSRGFICVVVLVTLPMHVAVGQWFQTSGPTGGSIVSIVAKSQALYVSSAGGVYRSSDSGSTWTPLRNGIPDLVVSDLSVHDTDIFAAGIYTIYRSTDDGASWVAKDSGLQTAGMVYTLAWQGGTLLAGGVGGVFGSSDLGNHWGPMGLDNFVVTSLAADSSTIIASTVFRGVFRSSDAGVSWTPTDSDLSASHVRRIAFISGAFLAATDSGIFVSTDKGITWSLAHTGTTPLAVTAFCVTDSLVYAGGIDLYVSVDSGHSWTMMAKGPPAGWSIRCLLFSGRNLYVVNDEIYLSTDDGSHWTEKTAGAIGTSVYHLLASGGDLFGISDYRLLVHSTDHGDHWERIRGGIESKWLTDLLFDSGYLFVATHDSGIYKSPDRGLNWTASDSGMLSLHPTTFAVKQGIIYAGTSDSGVYRSSDQGASWSPMNLGLQNLQIDQLVTTTNRLFAVKGLRLVVYDDSTQSWLYLNPGGYSLLPASVYFASADERNIHIATYNYGLLHSSDEGSSWILDTAAGSSMWWVQSMKTFTNTLIVGYLDSSVPGISATSDFGIHWKSLSEGLPFTSPLSFAFDSTYAYAGTGGLGVWRRNRSEVVTGLTDRSVVGLPQGLVLFQNYPNPFNPTTTIDYTLPCESKVELMIYDVLGRRLETLVNAVQSPGLKSVAFDAGMHPSGVYICRLHAGNVVQTTKLLLVR